MNIPLDRKLCRPAPPPAGLGEATAVAIGASLSAVFLDRPAGRRERMTAEQDGLPLPRPFIAAELPLRSGGARHVLFVAQGIQTLLSRHLVLRLDGMPAAQIDPTTAAVSLPETTTYYDRILDRLLFQAKLKYQLRTDEAGKPFLWITAIRQ